MELIYSPVIKVDEHLAIATSHTNLMAITFMLLLWGCNRPSWCFFHCYICWRTKNTCFTLTSILDRTGRHWALLSLSVEEYGIPGSWYSRRFFIIAVQKGCCLNDCGSNISHRWGAIHDLLDIESISTDSLMRIWTSHTEVEVIPIRIGYNSWHRERTGWGYCDVCIRCQVIGIAITGWRYHTLGDRALSCVSVRKKGLPVHAH